MAEVPRYRLIYNWDGAPPLYSEVPQSQEAFLEKVYAPLVETQVDALFYCPGEHASTWPSKVMDWEGEFTGRRYRLPGTYRHAENLRQAYERGENPYQAMIERGRRLGTGSATC